MNFYEHQDKARKKSRRLVVLFVLALCITVYLFNFAVAYWLVTQDHSNVMPFHYVVWPNLDWWSKHSGEMILSTLCVVVFVGAASLYKIMSLRQGGQTLAQQVGATAVSHDSPDPLHRRLLNVTEEMAIASGVPVPRVFVMEEESAINAFVSGFNHSDAVMVVSRGALEQLSRDELQGVVAHEFSHLMNGDMRMNIHLVGVLFGLIVMGIVGRLIIRASRGRDVRLHRYLFVRGKRERQYSGLIFIGLALYVIGYVGVFFGRYIRAGISRQREYLADASAVQLTRQTRGISGALKKIAGTIHGSYLHNGRSEEIGHMLFATGQSYFSGLATHPPLGKRIHALDPSFKPETIKHWNADPIVQQSVAELIEAGRLPSDYGYQALRETMDHRLPVTSGGLTEHIGQPGPEHIIFAQGVRASIPEPLYQAAHSSSQCLALLMALLLHREAPQRAAQLRLLKQRLGPTEATLIQQLHDNLRTQSLAYRLPLFAIVFPTLKLRPLGHLEFIIELAVDLVSQDGELDSFEIILLALLRIQFFDVVRPDNTPSRTALRQSKTAAAFGQVLWFCASAAHEAEHDAINAAQLGMTSIYGTSPNVNQLEVTRPVSSDDVYQALLTLDGLGMSDKQSVVNALVATMQFDGKVTPLEAELLRGVLACLHIPVAPILKL